MKVPEDEIFCRPESKEGNEGRERLIRAASRVGYEHVKAEQREQEQALAAERVGDAAG